MATKTPKIQEAPEHDLNNGNIWVPNIYFDRFLMNASFGESIMGKSWKAKAAMRLGRLIKTIETAGQVYTEVKKSTIQKYAAKDKDNNLIETAEGGVTIMDVPVFNAEMKELSEDMTDLGVKPIEVNLDEAPDLSIEEANFLEPLIVTDD
jgi:hypothetical protein